MNIKNSKVQFNTSSGLNIGQGNNISRSRKIKSDNFQKSLYTTAPKSISKPQNNIPISNSYSSKQLLSAYSNPSYVKSLIDANPDIKNILQENNLDGNIYPENINKFSKSHIIAAAAVALQIADEMNISQADKKILEQACVFHDFGKILIPPEILQKPGALNDEEKKIMDLHSELGYELLSNTGMNKRVLELVKNHHNPQDANTDTLQQILCTADIYSALIEQRSYKPSFSSKDALSLLEQKAQKGEISKDTVNALKNTLNKTSSNVQ